MKHNTLRLLFTFIVLLLSLHSAIMVSAEEDLSDADYKGYVDSGMVFGVQAGDVMRDVAVDFFHADNKSILEYSSVSDALAALNLGKVNAVLLASGYLGPLKASNSYPGFEYIIMPEDVYINEAGPIFHEEELRDKYNNWLEEQKANGTWQEICDFWMGGALPEQKDIPLLELTGENGTIIMADTANYPPLSYIGENGEVIGMDVDIMSRFAQSLGMGVDIRIMSYDAIAPFIVSGKGDMSCATLTITDERQQGMLFGAPTVVTHGVLVVNKGYDNAAGSGNGIIQWIKEGVEKNLIKEDRYKMIVDGLLVTLEISLFSQIFGTVIGSFIAFLLTRKNRIILGITHFYNALIEGTPIVVILMVFYYIIFGAGDISSVIVAVIAFAIVEGVGIGSKLASAIGNVDITEIEAARSMGFSPVGTFLTVTLPQALKTILPGYLSGFVNLVKATAVVGYIAIIDLSNAGNIIMSRTYDAYFPILFVAVIYLLVTTVLVQIFKLIIRRVSK